MTSKLGTVEYLVWALVLVLLALGLLGLAVAIGRWLAGLGDRGRAVFDAKRRLDEADARLRRVREVAQAADPHCDVATRVLRELGE